MAEKSPIITTIKKVAPAVVSIMISKQLENDEQAMFPGFNMFNNPFSAQEEQGMDIPKPDMQQEHLQHHSHKKVPIGGGSGFFASKDGLILTNKHVVADPDAEYTIIAQNNKRYQARVLARDPINDVAILKVEANGLPWLELGNSNTLELGQTVIAIGNALGTFQNTVSTGIVSGLSRFIQAHDSNSGSIQKLRGLIQTDAAINPGNSGGPLVDIDGRVIGINSAIIFGAQNIGFAIPINGVKKDLESVKEFGRLRIPSLGVRHLLITPQTQQEFRLPVSHGALVISEHLPNDFAVLPDSPAAHAGIAEGDIILEFNNKKITPDHTLEYLINQCEIGSSVTIKVLRRNEELEMHTTLTERK